MVPFDGVETEIRRILVFLHQMSTSRFHRFERTTARLDQTVINGDPFLLLRSEEHVMRLTDVYRQQMVVGETSGARVTTEFVEHVIVSVVLHWIGERFHASFNGALELVDVYSTRRMD